MSKGVTLLVGTKKGLYLYRSDAERRRWTAEGQHFPGEPIYHAALDERDGATIYAGVNQTWGGPRIEVSRDRGKTWKASANPAFPADTELAFKRTWHFEPGPASQPDVVWAGVEPAALFRSDDRGETWSLVRALQDHPTRPRWEAGGGGLCLHSIAIDPKDSKRMSIGISAAGIFRTTDGGKTWDVQLTGVVPFEGEPGEKGPELNVCPHRVLAHPVAPDTLFLRSHERVYWWDAAGSRWEERTAGLPSDFGFAGAIHPRDPNTSYVIPLGTRDRLAQEPGIAVYATRDRGKTWERHDRGLPARARLEVLRAGMSTDRLDPAGIYFGSTNGEVWASRDEGRSWEQVAAHLPLVYSVSAATSA
ncbi:MAG: exo-alpha-sialidase [Candidatus Limnocylindria bacterium]